MSLLHFLALRPPAHFAYSHPPVSIKLTHSVSVSLPTDFLFQKVSDLVRNRFLLTGDHLCLFLRFDCIL